MSLTTDAWNRIEALSPQIKITARHVASRTGGDVDELVSIGRLAIIEEAQEDPAFLDQTANYITTFASWRMLDQVNRPRWAEKNSVPLDSLDAQDLARPSFEEHALEIQTIIDSLDDEDLTIIRAILEYGTEVLHSNGNLNVNALARVLDYSKSTMYRRVRDLQATLTTVLAL